MKCIGQYFFKIHFFKLSLILSGYFFITFIWPTFANIYCPLFSKDGRFEKILLFFNPRLNIFLIPSWAKLSGWKISGGFSVLGIKSRSTMIVKNWPNKNLSRFLGQNFVLFTYQIWRDNSYIFKQFFGPMSAYSWRDFTSEKKEEKNSKLLF